MNKQDITKLKILLNGLINRYKENELFFIDFKGEMLSGSRVSPIEIELVDSRAIITFPGQKLEVSLEMLPDTLADICMNFDKVNFEYRERNEYLIIEADGRNVRSKNGKNINELTGNRNKDVKHKHHIEDNNIRLREYFIKADEAVPLLAAIGIMSENGKLRNEMMRKYNQIDNFIEKINDMLSSFEDNIINIVDCACGKSYLSFALNYYICEKLRKKCFITGLDTSKGVITSSIKIADELGYRNMEFINADINDFIPQKKIHLVISLHACDTATDKAMAFMIKSKALSGVFVPCCQHQLNAEYNYAPFESILKHGILKARIADALTDGMRILLLSAYGYQSRILEYISPLDTPKNLMIISVLPKHYSAGTELFANTHERFEYERMKKLVGSGVELEKYLF